MTPGRHFWPAPLAAFGLAWGGALGAAEPAVAVVPAAVAAAVAAATYPVPPQAARTPATAVMAAATDLATLPAEVRCYVRYVSLYNLPDGSREKAGRVLSGVVNSMSRGKFLRPLTQVTADWSLYRIDDIRHYKWDRAVWDKLFTDERYFTDFDDASGAAVMALWVGEGDRQQSAAAYLRVESHSFVPVVRGDQFLAITAVQEGHDGRGYYDFLGLGLKGDDFDKLVGKDGARNKDFRRLRAIVPRSAKVSINNRQIDREPALSGAYWKTLDSRTNVGRQDAIAHPLDFKPDAAEEIGGLPNGWPAAWLQNEPLEQRQNSAPDFIAHNTNTFRVDGRVHAPGTCWRCHGAASKGGALHPIDDWARAVLGSGQTFQVAPKLSGLVTKEQIDHAYEVARQQSEELLERFTSDLERQRLRDNEAFDAACRETTGLGFGEWAAAFGQLYDRYLEEGVTVERAEEELGIQAGTLLPLIDKYAGAARFKDPHLVSWTAARLPPQDRVVRREHFETIYRTLQILIRGRLLPQ